MTQFPDLHLFSLMCKTNLPCWPHILCRWQRTKLCWLTNRSPFQSPGFPLMVWTRASSLLSFPRDPVKHAAAFSLGSADHQLLLPVFLCRLFSASPIWRNRASFPVSIFLQRGHFDTNKVDTGQMRATEVSASISNFLVKVIPGRRSNN